jgi:hypothetical protein
MRRMAFLWLAGMGCAGGAGVCLAAPMDSIYLCVDSDGNKTYQNQSDGSSCHRVDGIVSTIPASEFSGRGARASLAHNWISPASFPRVDAGTQRLRDGDRRRILEEELRAEQERLAQLRSQFNRGQPERLADETSGPYRERVQRLFEDIERSEGNVASLRRELTPTRY